MNYGIFTEGFDADATEVVVIARAVKSRSLYAQMVGRATRPLKQIIEALAACCSHEERVAMIAASKKPNCIVIDLVGATGEHKLVTMADILGGNCSELDIEKIKKKIADGEKDVIDAINKFEEEKQANEIESLRGVVVETTMQRRFIDPFDQMDRRRINELPLKKQHPATPEQLQKLTRHGMRKSDEKLMTYERASKLLNAINERRKNNLCTIKQARILERHGENPNVSYEEASRIIDRIAANGWKPLNAAHRKQ